MYDYFPEYLIGGKIFIGKGLGELWGKEAKDERSKGATDILNQGGIAAGSKN